MALSPEDVLASSHFHKKNQADNHNFSVLCKIHIVAYNTFPIPPPIRHSFSLVWLISLLSTAVSDECVVSRHSDFAVEVVLMEGTGIDMDSSSDDSALLNGFRRTSVGVAFLGGGGNNGSVVSARKQHKSS